MGGFDGVTFSNTYFLEYTFGWKGILIEPDPDRYKDLLVNRPHVIAFNEIICDRRDVTFLNGGPVGGASDFFTPEWFEIYYKNESPKSVTLPCQSLSSILDSVYRRSGITCYDFFSLDVEGAELSVVKTIDFQRFQFKVIAVEEDGFNVTKDEEVASILRENGYVKYELAEDERNGWYVLRNAPSACH